MLGGIEVTDPISRHEFDMLQEHIDGKLTEIQESLLAMWKKIDGRPSWAVVTVISIETTVIGILGTALISMLMKGSG